MGQALRFLRQTGIHKEPGCNSPYMVGGTMEVAICGPHDGYVSTRTCTQCPQTSVLLWMFIVPNRGMMTLCVVWMCPWMSSKQNPVGAVGQGLQRGLPPTGPLPLACLWDNRSDSNMTTLKWVCFQIMVAFTSAPFMIIPIALSIILDSIMTSTFLA